MTPSSTPVNDAGAGLPPVVLLHGWGGSFASTWDGSGWTASLRQRGRRVIGIDLPGHGTTAGGANPFDPASYGDLAGLVRKRLPEQGPVDVIAYSLGAKLTLAMAIREPALIRRAVLCGLGGNVFAPERLGDVLARLLETGIQPDAPAPLAELVRYGLGAGNDPARLAAVLRRPPNPVIAPEDLHALRGPFLVVAGNRDTVAQPLEPLLDALPNVRSLILPDIDHLSLPAQPAVLDAAIGFLSEE